MTAFYCKRYCEDLHSHGRHMYERGQVYCCICRKAFESSDCVGIVSNRCPCCCVMVRRNARSMYAHMRPKKARY
jgi:hypothetical protein